MRPVGRRNAPAWRPRPPRSPLRVIRAVMVRVKARPGAAWRRGRVILPRLGRAIERTARPGLQVVRLGYGAFRRGRVVWRRLLRWVFALTGSIVGPGATAAIVGPEVTAVIGGSNVSGEVVGPDGKVFFPTTPILDNFNRSDEGPPPSAQWTSFGFQGGQVSQNLCAGGSNFWLDLDFGANCEDYVTVVHRQEDIDEVTLFVRAGASDAGGGYGVLVIRDGALAHVYLQRFWLEILAGPVEIEYNDGDSFGLRAVGNVITAYYRPVGEDWQVIMQVEDGVYSEVGYMGIIAYSAYVDDFGGGTYVPSTSVGEICGPDVSGGIVDR